MRELQNRRTTTPSLARQTFAACLPLRISLLRYGFFWFITTSAYLPEGEFTNLIIRLSPQLGGGSLSHFLDTAALPSSEHRTTVTRHGAEAFHLQSFSLQAAHSTTKGAVFELLSSPCVQACKCAVLRPETRSATTSTRCAASRGIFPVVNRPLWRRVTRISTSQVI